MPEAVVHVRRTRLLWRSRLYERVSLVSFGREQALVPLVLEFAADFRDMFEVRGARRAARGQVLPPLVTGDAVTLRHQELDGLPRTSVIAFCPAPPSLSAQAAVFEAAVSAGGRTDIFVEVGIEPADPPCQARFRAASARARHGMRSSRRRGATVSSSGRLFNEWLGKSRPAPGPLTHPLPTGPHPPPAPSLL